MTIFSVVRWHLRADRRAPEEARSWDVRACSFLLIGVESHIREHFIRDAVFLGRG